MTQCGENKALARLAFGYERVLLAGLLGDNDLLERCPVA